MGDNDDVNFDWGFGVIMVVVAMLVVLVMLVIMITVVWMEFEKNSLIFIFTMTGRSNNCTSECFNTT